MTEKTHLSTEGDILLKYYWTHRDCRVSKLHKFANMRYKDVEDIAYSKKRPTNEELRNLIVGLRRMRSKLNTVIDICIKEFDNLYECRKQHDSCQ